MKSAFPEIVAIGIYNTNAAVKNKAVTQNRKTTMFEIELPIGEGGTTYIDQASMPVRGDTLICAKPGQIRHTRLPFQCYYIHFILQEGALYDRAMKLPNFVKTEHIKEYEDLFRNLCKYEETALENDELLLHSLLLKLLYLLLGDAERTSFQGRIKNNNHEATESTIRYIKENLTADLSLQTLAQRVGFSPNHFHNCFKASTGRTVREYVEDQRIKKAANLLVSTNHTLTEIAYECGFSSQSYFSFAFKRKMHQTPREYAKTVFKRYEKNR